MVMVAERILDTPTTETPGITCIVCHMRAPDREVIAGSQGADGQPAFACKTHMLRERRLWITAWAAFENEQARRRSEKSKGTTGTTAPTPSPPIPLLSKSPEPAPREQSA